MESLVFSKRFNLRRSQIMMNCVLRKLKSLFDNFNHIYNTVFKTSNPSAWFAY